MIKNCSYLQQRSAGLFKTGILLLLVAVAVTGFTAWRGLVTLRWGMSECLQWQGTILAERFIIQDQQYDKLNQMVREFAGKIAAGNISPFRGFAVLRAFYKGPVLLALLQTSLLNRIHNIETPEDTDLNGMENTSRQFFLAVKSGRISTTDWETVHGQLMEEKISATVSSIGFIIPEPIETFRKKIGLQTLFKCLAQMDQATRLVEVSTDDATLNPVEELHKIIAATTANTR